jgi:hypothetical protein
MTSQEELEDLAAIARHPGFKPLCSLMSNILAKLGAEMLSVSLPANVEEATVKVYEKRCRYDGAKAGFDALQNRLKEIKGKEM